jgi:hypothetical protein
VLPELVQHQFAVIDGLYCLEFSLDRGATADRPVLSAIVERYENEGSQKYHLENPYWKTFDPYVKVSVSL